MRMTRAALAIAGAWLGASTTSAHALELSAATGLLQLPSSSYHYLAYNLRASFGDVESSWVLNAGLTQPYSLEGYSEWIVFGDFGHEWAAGKDHLLKPYFGAALGAYDDRVNNQDGLTPSLVMHGGVRIGGEHFGGALSANIYLGIYDIGQIFSFTAWPMTNFLGAIYVAL